MTNVSCYCWKEVHWYGKMKLFNFLEWTPLLDGKATHSLFLNFFALQNQWLNTIVSLVDSIGLSCEWRTTILSLPFIRNDSGTGKNRFHCLNLTENSFLYIYVTLIVIVWVILVLQQLHFLILLFLCHMNL